MEGIVQRGRDHHNVMVMVQELWKTEQIVTLEESEGEFLCCDPGYRDTPPQRTRLAQDTELLGSLRQLLHHHHYIVVVTVFVLALGL